MSVDTDTPAAPLGFAYHGKFLLLVLLVSSVIAVLLTLMDAGYAALPSELLVSNTIGLCIWLTAEAIQKVGRGRLGVVPGVIIAIPFGIVVGSKLATVFGASDLIGIWTHDPVSSWKSISVSLLFAAGASAYIIQHTVTNNYRLELESERRRSAEASRSQAVAELALLQAQIEPHFLFNTLAHVQSAIEQEPAVGKAMLEHLIRYLRGALQRSRQSNCTLVEEQELVEPLLAIAAGRLGARLRYHVVIPDALRDAKVPPLLLQPLVENAIKHGIEPAVAGGEIRVQGELDDGALVLRVSDTGVGMSETAPEGVGLSNVRARLASLYGSKGRLTLQRNPVGGTIAELRLPWERLG
jgi:Histidine kinase/Histidine kinase-, DNA gyrase B-, and HSP90-like ATPase